MARMLEAIFYNEDAAQNAITSLENEHIDISAVTLHSAGKSLIAQTFENTKRDVLGSSTGFAYNAFPADTTPSITPYPLPNTTAIVADNGLHANHKFSIKSTESLPHEKEDVSGASVVLTMHADDDGEGKAENILRLCGAYRIRLLYP